MRFHADVLNIDAKRATEQIADSIRRQIRIDLRKEGAVVGISGGVDSAVVASLCVEAVGPEKVLGVAMPERDSSPESIALAEQVAQRLQIRLEIDDITPALEGFGCYRRRDEAIRRVFPEFAPGYKAKITIASQLMERETLNFFRLTIESPEGSERTRRIPFSEFLQIVAASNLKQRARMATLYYHAERLNRAVVGTGNKDEHELGFFVKYGDGGVDLKPIAHLYKVQIYQLAYHLGIPQEIIKRTPTTDTYSAEVTQREFFFGVDFSILDPVWCALEQGVPADEAALALNLTSEQVERIYKDIERKRRTTRYLRRNPLLWNELSKE